MLISPSHKFIFIHATKTAGNSMKKYLREFASAESSRLFMHSSALTIRECFPSEVKDYFVFTFVRNPYDRLVSLYSYSKQVHYASRPFSDNPNISFRDFVFWILKHPSHMESINFGWFRGKDLRVLPKYRRLNKKSKGRWLVHPQHLYTEAAGQKVANFIGRYENLDDDFRTVCQRIKVPEIKLEKINSSKHKHYSEYYDEDLRDVVYSMYQHDFEEFGYSRSM